ncbi:hypothetical protein V8E54_011192 [Elaphomyces granulatus]
MAVTKKPEDSCQWPSDLNAPQVPTAYDSQIFMPTDVAKSDSTQITTLAACHTGGYGLILRSQRSSKTTDSARQTADQEGEYNNPEKNILRWVVTSKQPFTVVQDPDFKQIFLSLATHDRSVARCNSLPILAIIGHWLMEFEYRQQQQVIESTELQGPHSGENLAATVDPGIGPCSPIAGANAGNSETMFSNLHRRLPARIGLRRKRETEG